MSKGVQIGTGTESSTRMKAFRSVEREVSGEIMRTDIFVKIVSETRSEADLKRDLEDSFAVFRDVETRFSRFRPESELSVLNGSSEMRVSSEMAHILAESVSLHDETGGIFDPSVLECLESSGYAGSFDTASFGVPSRVDVGRHSGFGELVIDSGSGVVRKPVDLRIDLGGIAKGYAVDKVVRMLRERGNTDFLVDAGGDIYASGADLENGYDFWGIDIAKSSGEMGRAALLTLHDMAVATSGTDRRRWSVEGEARHHLIDPRTGNSARTDLVSVTVVGATVSRAEVIAKTVCILGRERGLDFATNRRAAVFMTMSDGKTVYNEYMKPYIYDEKN